ncbi:MAG: hypothetical protein LC667_04085 [Thioalkalivibrio sp.]|nr:hypothetical protein [Thioalkalivibrio sp.]
MALHHRRVIALVLVVPSDEAMPGTERRQARLVARHGMAPLLGLLSGVAAIRPT